MKTLLVAINAKYIHSNLAIYNLKAYAEKFGCVESKEKNAIELAEYTINQYSDKILTDIYTRKPDIIGFSCYIWNISIVEELLENISDILPDTKIWVGGPEVSYNAEEFLDKHKNVTGVIIGEGEETNKEVLDAYCLAGDDNQLQEMLSGIKGIAYRKNEHVVTNENREQLDLTKVPFVYKDYSNFENRIVYYESSRGCPFSCSYCLSSIDKKLRFRDIELVKEELKFFLDNNTAQVKFVDRTFNCNHNHAMEIWTFIKENDNGITNFHFEIAADILSDEEIKLISTMRPGLIQLEIGVQTTNVNTIQLINRKMDFEVVSRTVKKLKESKNVHLHLDLIAGLPKENLESFINSFNMVYAIKPEQLQLGFLKVLHGSLIKSQVEENGMKYQKRAPYEVLSTKWIGYEDILKLKNVEEVLEIYYNSGQFTNSISKLEEYFDNAFQMYEKLGEFYQKSGINGEKHSRIRRYEILLEFFREQISHSEDEIEIFMELLTLDTYLRDNIKSKPSFESEQDEYKKQFVQIYRQEERERTLLPEYGEYNSKQMAKMTHIHVFRYMPEKYEIEKKEKYYVMFDYKNRDPLTNDARVIFIPEKWMIE